MDFNQVPMKYSYKTRLGNWSEEWELEQTRLKDYIKSKEKGNLETLKIEQRKDQVLRPASLTYIPDNNLVFNAQFKLYNLKMEGILASNIWNKLVGIDEAYSVSLSKEQNATRRTVFTLEKVDQEYRDNYLHYGQKVYVLAHQNLLAKKLFLKSCPISPNNVARVSRKQEVSITSKESTSNIWIVEHIDPKLRFEALGEVVKANEPLLFKHHLTGQWLASDNYQTQNNYGLEYEVFSFSYTSHGKTQNLIAEKAGRSTIDFPMRRQGDENAWVCVTAMKEDDEFNEEQMSKPKTASDIVNGIARALKTKGAYGLRSIRRTLNNIDTEKTGKISKVDLKWAFRCEGIDVPDLEINTLQETFSSGNDVNYQAILLGAIPKQPAERIAIIEKLWKCLTEEVGEKGLTLEYLSNRYDANVHPLVKDGIKIQKEVFNDYLKNWNIKDPQRSVTKCEFLEYYADISAAIERRDVFETVVCAPLKI